MKSGIFRDGVSSMSAQALADMVTLLALKPSESSIESSHGVEA